jgi:hypothetical protein
VSTKTGDGVEAAMRKFVEMLVLPDQNRTPMPVQVVITNSQRQRKATCCGK